ncbi:MAG TPA: retropepsin-like aspartic protease [Rhizomicrobium sp.]|nr:retropepsin-like aspartic protease [Rhizomicrobium sp.]
MRNIRALAGSFLLAVCYFSIASAHADECKLVEIAALNAKIDSDGGITVPAMIEGHEAYLLIDTGGIYNLLTTKTIDDMHLSRVAINPGLNLHLGASGVRLLNTAIIHSFQLGNLSAGHIPFVEIPPGYSGNDNAGTLGPAVLSNYELEIDPMGKTVNLFSHDHCPGQVIYWTRATAASVPMRLDSWLHIIVPVMLDGQPVNAMVDTGRSASLLTYDRAENVFSKDASPKDPATSGSYSYPFKTLSLDGVVVTNPNITVVPDKTPAGEMPPLILGMDVLSHLHVFISYQERRLYVTAAAAH